MKCAILTVTVFGLCIGAVPAGSSAGERTQQTARKVIALVNGEEIYLDELEETVASRHREMSETSRVAWVGYADALDRLISSRLVVQEAMDVGLDERPEIREKVRRFADRTLVRMLQKNLLKDVEADEDDINRMYRDEVRRWTFKAISFPDLDKAGAFRTEVKDGGDFEAAGEKYVSEGAAAWEGFEREVREAEIAPEISAAFLGKETGAVTQVIQATDRFYVFKLTGVSYPDDPAALRRVTRKALAVKRKVVLREHTDDLVRKYAEVDRDVLASIGKGDYINIEKDLRVVARIPGEDPVLAVDLLRHLEGQSYHGGNIQEHTKIITADPSSVLSGTLEEMLYLKEARRLGIDGNDQYLEKIAAYERSLVFGMYIEEFLVPQVRLTDEEVQAAYDTRKEEFLMPQTIRVQSLTFTEKDSAEKALKSLKRGADLKWLSRNAKGLKGDQVLDEELVLEKLPQDLQGKMGKARPGDVGVFESVNNTYRVYTVRDRPPRAVQPFEKVRPVIAKELFNERVNGAFENLVAELRALSNITIYEDKLDKGPFLEDRNVH